MDIELFARGLVIGLAIAAPVGPIGLLCIRRSLADGFPLGFLTGLGAAAADGVYGAIAAFGLTAVSSFLVAQQRWLALGGGLALLWLGWQSIRRPPADTAADGGGNTSRAGAFASTFVLTLANPATISDLPTSEPVPMNMMALVTAPPRSHGHKSPSPCHAASPCSARHFLLHPGR